MKALTALCALVVASALQASPTTAPAFPFSYYIHDTTGKTGDAALPSTYQFPTTSLGSNSNIVLKIVNTSSTAAFLSQVFVSAGQNTTTLNQNFTVTGFAIGLAIPSGGSFIFTVNFSPTSTGQITGYLQTSYQVQQTVCSFTSTLPDTQCPSGLNLSSTLNGIASQPELVLSYPTPAGDTILQPSGTPINFGNVSLSATSAITFTLSNQSAVPIDVPSIKVPAPTTYTANPFLLDTSQVPATLAAGTAANFTITFEPGQMGLATTNLLLGPNTYALQGAGIVVAGIDALQISYVDLTGVRGLPQAATPISFGQVVAGTAGANVLTFTVLNPNTSFNAVKIPGITVTGGGFTYASVSGAAAFPISVAPGSSISFKIAFSPATAGAYTGALSIGTRSFALAGTSINSPLPTFSLAVSPLPLTSRQQATVAIQFSAPSTLNLVGTITMSFTPSVVGAADDPAILFLTNGARTISVTVASGAQTAVANGQSVFAFQTGTTAGTITFSVAFPNTAPYTQSFSITPAIAQITSASAVRSNPNLVVTIAGYDNTYSAGQLNFTFYDAMGKTIAPISINAASNFQSLFFNSNTGGGAFSLQATFPVTGDVTKVGSVAVTLNNSAGTASTTQTFQ